MKFGERWCKEHGREDLINQQPKSSGLNRVDVKINGRLSNRPSYRELESLLFAINYYVGIKEQMTS